MRVINEYCRFCEERETEMKKAKEGKLFNIRMVKTRVCPICKKDYLKDLEKKETPIYK